jgi:SlyX protein
MNEERFIDIESKVTHQEFLLEKLNQIVYQQQQKIDQLEDTLVKLGKRLQETGTAPSIGPADERPPHY